MTKSEFLDEKLNDLTDRKRAMLNYQASKLFEDTNLSNRLMLNKIDLILDLKKANSKILDFRMDVIMNNQMCRITKQLLDITQKKNVNALI